MHRERTVARREVGQPLEEGLQALRGARRHHRGRDLLGARDVAVHRDDERARAPCTTIALEQQRIELLDRELRLPRNPQRQRVAPDRLIIGRIAERDTVIALRPFLLADQVVSEAAVGGEIAWVEA